MSYITKWKKRKAEVDKLLIIDASDSESEAPIETTASLVDKNTIQSPYGTPLAEELYDLSQCSSHYVSDQLPELNQLCKMMKGKMTSTFNPN